MAGTSYFFNIATDDFVGDSGNWFNRLFGSSTQWFKEDHAPDAVEVNVPVGVLENQAETRRYIIDTLVNHAMNYGPLDEVTIMGHGSETWSGFGNLGEAQKFLTELQAASEQYHVKLANRIVLAGCGTLQYGLQQEDFNKNIAEGPHGINAEIAFLRDYARNNDVEIVGTTTKMLAGPTGDYARYVKFTPDGDVKRDRLDNETSVVSSALARTFGFFAGMIDDKLSTSDEPTWEECHLGQLQKAGAACYSRKNDQILKLGA